MKKKEKMLLPIGLNVREVFRNLHIMSFSEQSWYLSYIIE